MPELELTPHPDAERSHAELRSEFRASALANLRSQYAGHHPVGWQMIGDTSTSRDKYGPSDWGYEMLCRLDGHVTQDFGLQPGKHYYQCSKCSFRSNATNDSVPSCTYHGDTMALEFTDDMMRLSVRLENLAKESVLHESATWDDSVAGVTDHDSPACAPVESMTDDEICDYVNKSIEDSERG